jgi:Cu(I)/Ag(I) efflux system protein CusF
MKIATVAAIAMTASFALQAGHAIAQPANAKDEHAHHMPMDSKAPATAYKASGVVKKIDAAKGSVTLAHGPVAELKWPAMTMGFTVKDKALLGKLAVGRKVDFEFIEQGKSYVVTAVR